ncbi:MAG: hypothetical protein ACFCU8_13875 [Thermosynechococcaceae cyanobacterium]
MVSPSRTFNCHRSLVQQVSTILFLCIAPLAPFISGSAANSQTYLYGESAQVNQVGKGYVVFQRRGEQVVGAFHHPQSEFSCFTGKMTGQQLDVVTLESEQEESVSVRVPLSQLHHIETTSASVQNSLKTCQQDVAALGVQQQAIAKNLTP